LLIGETELQIEFQKNINEDVSSVKFTREELEGLPEDFINNLKTIEAEGKSYYVVTLKYPDLIPTLQMAKR
jgi:metallopeptidase MepB